MARCKALMGSAVKRLKCLITLTLTYAHTFPVKLVCQTLLYADCQVILWLWCMLYWLANARSVIVCDRVGMAYNK